MIPFVFNNDLNTPRYLYKGRYSCTKVEMLTPVTATFQVNNNYCCCLCYTDHNEFDDELHDMRLSVRAETVVYYSC